VLGPSTQDDLHDHTVPGESGSARAETSLATGRETSPHWATLRFILYMWCALIVLFVTAVFLLDRLGDRVVSRMASKREIAWARHNLEERGFVPYEDTYMTEQCIKAVEAGGYEAAERVLVLLNNHLQNLPTLTRQIEHTADELASSAEEAQHALVMKGVVRLRSGRPDEAAHILERAVKTDGTDPNGRFWLWRSYISQGDVARAIAQYKEFDRLKRGRSALVKNEIDSANNQLKLLHQELAQTPDDIALRTRYAEALIDTGRFAELPAAVELLAKDPRTAATAEYYLGVAAENDGELTAAGEHYGKALAATANHWLTLRRLSRTTDQTLLRGRAIDTQLVEYRDTVDLSRLPFDGIRCVGLQCRPGNVKHEDALQVELLCVTEDIKLHSNQMFIHIRSDGGTFAGSLSLNDTLAGVPEHIGEIFRVTHTFEIAPHFPSGNYVVLVGTTEDNLWHAGGFTVAEKQFDFAQNMRVDNRGRPRMRIDGVQLEYFTKPEEMLPLDTLDDGSIGLFWNGRVLARVQGIPTGKWSALVEARGATFNGTLPRLQMLLNNTLVGETEIDNKTWQQYRFDLGPCSNTCTLACEFINDGGPTDPATGLNRDVYIRKIELVGPASSPAR